MALNSLKIATGGYLKQTTKAVLVIAVAGYLNFANTPPDPHQGRDGWYSGRTHRSNEHEKSNKTQIEIDDSEIVAIVELTLKQFII